MNLDAAGAYLRQLRELAGFSQAKLGTLVGVTDEIILRVEKGRGDTSGVVLLRWVAKLDGSHRRLLEILENPDVTVEVAQELARTDKAISYEVMRTDREQQAVELFDAIQRIGLMPNLEARVEALRQLPLWMFRVVEALAVDLMRAAIPPV